MVDFNCPLTPYSCKLEVTQRPYLDSGSLSYPEYFVPGAACFVVTSSGGVGPDCPQTVI